MPTKAQVGEKGEKAVEKQLDKLPMKDYYVFYDVMLRHHNGNTAQIDFIVVSRFGLFVVEVKNYKGTIIPAQYKSYIKQVTPYGEYLYPNPLYQNRWHIAAISDILGSSKGIIPIVVFSGANSVQLGKDFLSLNKLVPYILSYDKEIFSLDEYASAVRLIGVNNVYEEQERAKHIKTKPKKAKK